MNHFAKIEEWLETGYQAHPGCRLILEVPKPTWDACLAELRQTGRPRCLLDYPREHFVWRDEVIAHGKDWRVWGMNQ